MGFRFRRSLKIIPGVRLNISKSGASVSFGGRGAHYTIGPKGTRTTVGIPGTGLSWTNYKSHSTNPRRLSDHTDLLPAVEDPVGLRDDSELTPIVSSRADRISALSTSDLAPILDSARQRGAISPYFIATSGVLFLIAWASGTGVLLVPVALCSLVFWLAAIPLDQYRRSVAIEYEPSGPAAEAATALSGSFSALGECAAIWNVQSEGLTGDWKRHAGATRLNTRRRTYLQSRRPTCVRGHASFPCLQFGAQELYFLPDAALFVDHRSVAALHYRDLVISQEAVRFAEEERVPEDALVVDHTWRFVNRDGGPDRRFNNNRSIPVCLYGELDFHSAGGLHGRLQLSQSTAGERLLRVLGALAERLSSEETSKPITSHREPKTWPTIAFVCAALFIGFGTLGTTAFLTTASFKSAAPLPKEPTTVAIKPAAESVAQIPAQPPTREQIESPAAGFLVVAPPPAVNGSGAGVRMPMPKLRPRQN